MTAPGQVQSPINKPQDAAVQDRRAGPAGRSSPSWSALVWTQFRGGFADPEKLTLIAARSGLSMDPGSKVTFNGVEIGRVAEHRRDRPGRRAEGQGHPRRRPQVRRPDPGERGRRDQGDHGVRQQVHRLLVAAEARSPAARHPGRRRSTVSGVTTEFNTLFETVVSVTQKVDPIKLNQTLTATAQALDGLGKRFGAVDRERQHDPRRPQPADAADSARTTSGWPTSPTSTPTPRPTCSTA